MKLARICPSSCGCGTGPERCFTEREQWTAGLCPKCNQPIVPADEKRERTHGNRRFTEREGESMTQGFHPSEVKLAKKLMPRSADCIKDDGRVVYPDSQSEKTFRRELAGAKRRLGVPDSRPW